MYSLSLHAGVNSSESWQLPKLYPGPSWPSAITPLLAKAQTAFRFLSGLVCLPFSPSTPSKSVFCLGKVLLAQTRGEKIFKMLHFPTLTQIPHLHPRVYTPDSRVKVDLPVPVALVSRILAQAVLSLTIMTHIVSSHLTFNNSQLGTHPVHGCVCCG